MKGSLLIVVPVQGLYILTRSKELSKKVVQP